LSSPDGDFGHLSKYPLVDRARQPPTRRFGFLVLAAAASAVLLNVLLLNRASSSNDPVGKLSPTAHLPAQDLPAAPPGVVQPSTGPIEGEGKVD
jgi:hypothetical protein